MRESVICELSLCSGETKYTIHWKFPEIKISWKLLNRQDIWILERKGWAWHLVSPTYCTFSPFKTQPDPSVQTAQWEECLPASSVQGWMGVKTQDRPGLFKNCGVPCSRAHVRRDVVSWLVLWPHASISAGGKHQTRRTPHLKELSEIKVNVPAKEKSPKW